MERAKTPYKRRGLRYIVTPRSDEEAEEMDRRLKLSELNYRHRHPTPTEEEQDVE